ncbi:hypothetical protein BG000_011714 [Podila horticola]|nr:hypothetical protein BG000_011714 [Podila horticola]
MATSSDVEKSMHSPFTISRSADFLQQNSSNCDNIPFIPASLTVSNLHYEITVKRRASVGYKRFFTMTHNVQQALLSNVTIKATPGRVLAIMGPSGSGKTTLLDLITDCQSRNIGQLKGEILLNDLPFKKYGSVRRRLVGYVAQADDFVETLTVLETLTFAAMMKLPRSMCHQDKIARVYAVMQELKLTNIKDTKVGGAAIRGISGGEKRRVAIGIELLSSPSVLLLDEPTSGLSSSDALNVANAIKDLATKGCTIILTVHQPRSDIYELFDDLLLLSLGKVVYFGKAKSAASYFEDLGHECPVGWNVADYFLDLITLNQESLSREATSVHEDLAKVYSDYLSTNNDAHQSQLLQEHESRSDKVKGEALLNKFKEEYTTEYATTISTQTVLITLRSLTNLSRHPTILQAAAVYIIFALVIGSLFSGLKDRPEAGVIDFNGSILLFFITSFLGTMTFAAMPQSKTIVETLSYTILSVIFVVITYYLINLHGSLIDYLVLVGVFVNVALSVIAAIGAGAENAEVGMIFLVLINTVAMLFAGFLISRNDIPRGWIWAYWGSYYQWAFLGMMHNEFAGDSAMGTATLAYFGMDQLEWLTKWKTVMILLGYYVFVRFIGLVLLLLRKT